MIHAIRGSQLPLAVALLLVGCLPPSAQGGTTSAPYGQPPVVKGGPVPRLPDGKPDMQGYWAPRFNQAIYDIEDHPVGRQGIPAGKGAIVDPPAEKTPYKPEAAAHAKDLRENHVYDEPEAHCFMSGVPHTAYQQFGFQILPPAGYFILAYDSARL